MYRRHVDFMGNRRCIRCGGALRDDMRCGRSSLCSNSAIGIANAQIALELRGVINDPPPHRRTERTDAINAPEAPLPAAEHGRPYDAQPPEPEPLPPGWAEVAPAGYDRRWLHTSGARVREGLGSGAFHYGRAGVESSRACGVARTRLQAMALALGFELRRRASQLGVHVELDGVSIAGPFASAEFAAAYACAPGTGATAAPAPLPPGWREVPAPSDRAKRKWQHDSGTRVYELDAVAAEFYRAPFVACVDGQMRPTPAPSMLIAMAVALGYAVEAEGTRDGYLWRRPVAPGGGYQIAADTFRTADDAARAACEHAAGSEGG